VLVTLTGGEFRPSIEALTGPATIRELGQFHVAKLFSERRYRRGQRHHRRQRGHRRRLPTESEQARQTIVLADASKLERAGFAHIMPVPRVNILIPTPPRRLGSRPLRKKGVDVRLV
jgi:DeoR/GlpR family transcriptional regulator of sugar metabolism